mmetsp:Transcript_16954/g.18928  ORF Transcript_16954/g.18928 Transcript_16954/m.18928 type:complete len:131 (-) Transcript_16954:311-703(-)
MFPIKQVFYGALGNIYFGSKESTSEYIFHKENSNNKDEVLWAIKRASSNFYKQGLMVHSNENYMYVAETSSTTSLRILIIEASEGVLQNTFKTSNFKTQGEIDGETKLVISSDDTTLYFIPINADDRSEL